MEDQPEPPKPLRNRPEIYEDLQSVWECFWFLHPARPVGMDVGAILLTEIIAYWTMVGVGSREELMQRVALVRAMDNVYLEHARKRD